MIERATACWVGTADEVAAVVAFLLGPPACHPGSRTWWWTMMLESAQADLVLRLFLGEPRQDAPNKNWPTRAPLARETTFRDRI
ncbi:MAG: hypothetical protein H6518_05465 [Microthrixaceae bacterium]|nr:hypothetical protein [Microthrixaceae bacterium]